MADLIPLDRKELRSNQPTQQDLEIYHVSKDVAVVTMGLPITHAADSSGRDGEHFVLFSPSVINCDPKPLSDRQHHISENLGASRIGGF
jgi:hypothetical protein